MLKGYPIPGSEKVIPKGTHIIIPTWGLNMDEQFFPDPEIYNPGRFERETIDEKLSFYPLGAGPRYCFGGYRNRSGTR